MLHWTYYITRSYGHSYSCNKTTLKHPKAESSISQGSVETHLRRVKSSTVTILFPRVLFKESLGLQYRSVFDTGVSNVLGCLHVSGWQSLYKVASALLWLRSASTKTSLQTFGRIDVDVSDFFKLRCDDRNRGRRYKLFLPGCRSSVRQHFLSYRAVHTWNNLPANSTDFSNLRSFKRGLNSSLLARHSAVYYF